MRALYCVRVVHPISTRIPTPPPSRLRRTQKRVIVRRRKDRGMARKKKMARGKKK